MSPQRIQRKRTKGWRMPEGAIYVGRPSPWRNPFKVGEVYDRVLYSSRTMRGAVDQTVRDRAHAVELFQQWMDGERAHLKGYNPIPLPAIRRHLAGHDLVCWCPLEDEHGNRVPCHADVLLELANQGEVR